MSALEMSESPQVTGRGNLAQVIATRGGQASPEAPFVIEHREALIYMLCEAAELEHTIMCQYLFAAFSLKQTVAEGLSEAEAEAVGRWRRTISHVAAQEMLHLALVHNVLTAIGSAPHLGRPNLPQPANHYPAGVQLALLPFGEQALRHFMFLERPEGMDLKDAEGMSAFGRAEPLLQADDIVPRAQDFATVGHLYRSIEQGLEHLSEKYGEAILFVGPPEAQASGAHFGWPELVRVTDLESACAALDEILDQGEGPRGAWQSAHFGQFVSILDELLDLSEANPDFDPVRPVLVANVRPCPHAEITLIGEPLTARCTDLFNVAYEIALQALERYFAHTEETEAQLGTLANLSIGLMLRVIKPLGDLITTLPVGSQHPGMTAGPSFELFYESDYLMPHRGAAWALLEERLREAAQLTEDIRAQASEELAEALEPIGAAVVSLALSLAEHFGEWGATSRWAPPGMAEEASTAEEMGPDAGDQLADRANELMSSLEAGSSGDGDPIVSLLLGVHRLALDPSSPKSLVHGLVNSVMQPLVRGLSPETDQANAPAIAPSRAVGDASGQAGDHAAVWELAMQATRLRLSLPGATGLGEATAGLQRLARESDTAKGLDAGDKVSELGRLQEALSPGIATQTDGPYLVTNVERMTDWLGVPFPTLPTMALCRCGGSKLKPYCDGTHVELGFKGAKDPNRVPDRRDSYEGQQVTILDNRGTCQHAGYCTDRLAGVFRAHAEPFVAPSGGRMDEIIRAVRDCPSGALSFAVDGIEARQQVDRGHSREPAIEVSQDGPYRVTGDVALTAEGGDPEPRNDGASDEHYALCRCGQSQNKPFCSGMHWYVNFKDPVPPAQPTIFEWCGGLPALTRMTRLLYEKHVPADPVLCPLFAQMAPDQPERLAMWLAEAFGGPSDYSDRYGLEEGGYAHMVSARVEEGLTEEQRARWVSLLLQAADEAGLPSDAEFRAAFGSYLEWGSRLGLESSQPGVAPPAAAPLPRWDWSAAAGPPGSRGSAAPGTNDADAEAAAAPVLPGADETVGFAAHIAPLFREQDRRSMSFAFDLWSYEEVRQHAPAILARLQDGSMPCDSPWSADWIDVFDRWISSAMAP